MWTDAAAELESRSSRSTVRSVQIEYSYARLQRGACHNHGPWYADPEHSLELELPRGAGGPQYHPGPGCSDWCELSGFSELSRASAHCAAGRARERVGRVVWIRTESHVNVLELMFRTCGWGRGRRTCLACSTTYICTYATRDAPLCAYDDGAGPNVPEVWLLEHSVFRRQNLPHRDPSSPRLRAAGVET